MKATRKEKETCKSKTDIERNACIREPHGTGNETMRRYPGGGTDVVDTARQASALPRPYRSLDTRRLALTLVAPGPVTCGNAPVWTGRQRRVLPVVVTLATRSVVDYRTGVVGRHAVIQVFRYIGHLTRSVHPPHAAFQRRNMPLGRSWGCRRNRRDCTN